MTRTVGRYTSARRVLAASTGESGIAEGDDDARVSIGQFADQAYNAILLAEDEARMLGRPEVEPEHLLLAAARDGDVQSLLGREGITASAVHAVLVRRDGIKAQLVCGRVPHSMATRQVLADAVAAAAARGIAGPSSQHLLLGLAEQQSVHDVLRDLGISNARALVDATYPPTAPPLDRHALRRAALAARWRTAPMPGPIPAVFERFTVEARRAVDAAVASAHALGDEYVAPVHLLLGVLSGSDGVVACVRAGRSEQFAAIARRATAHRHGPSLEPTGIFRPSARRLVSEDVIRIAAGLGQLWFATGHLLLALVEDPDRECAEFLEPSGDVQALAAAVIQALPGDERTDPEVA